MKGLFFIFILLLSLVSFANEGVLNQKELISTLKDKLIEAPQFDKFKEVEAREAKSDEKIVTITGDGVETQNTAKLGDFIVRNTTDAKELYIIRGDKFTSRYELINKGSLWNRYKAIGSVKGIVVDEELIKELNLSDEFYIIAPWGEKMIVKKGDYLVSPLDYSEIYRIAKKEFFETYKDSK